MKSNNKTLPLLEIVKLTSATLVGSAANISIAGVSPLDDSRAGTISFVKAKQGKDILLAAGNTKASALFIDKTYSGDVSNSVIPLLVVAEPFQAAIKVASQFFASEDVSRAIHPTAVVDSSAKIGKQVTVHPYVVIGAGVEIGDDTIIHPHVVIYPRAKIGARCVLHSGSILREDCVLRDDVILQNGAVIGADGFGYQAHPTLGIAGIPQLGNVEISARGEVGANACIDRATFGTTRLGLATKIDNLVQIGHNCQVGKYSMICGSTAIGGSSKIGDGVIIGGSARVADHMNIVSNVKLAGNSTVTRNITKPGGYGGYPILPQRDFIRQLIALAELPMIVREWRKSRSNAKGTARASASASASASAKSDSGKDENE